MRISDLKEGYKFPTITKDPITRVQLVRYAGASGDFNPLHTVEEVGENAGTGIIAHGMLIMGMAAQGITTWLPRKNIKKFKFRFRNMTYPGETISISGIVSNIDGNKITGEVIAKNDSGELKGSGIFEAELDE